MEIQFQYLPALLLLLLVPILYFVYTKYNSEKKESILKFSSLKIIKKSLVKKSTIRKHLPFLLMLSILSLVIVGLANPQIPAYSSAKGMNIGIVLDGSESMAATDYEPTRLEAAKKAITKLVQDTNSENNIGIVLFESGATTISYLTPEKDKAVNSVNSISQGQGATAIGDGLALGIDMVTSIPDRKNMIILLSDGVHNSGVIDPDEAIQYAQINNVQIFTIGVGSQEPVYLGDNIYGEPQYAKLDEKALEHIAKDTGGTYYKSINEQTLNDIFTTISSNLEYETEYSTIRDYFIGAAIILLLVDAYVIYGRYRIIA